MFHPVLKSREKRHATVATLEVRESARSASRAHSLFALQHTHGGGLCPLGAGVTAIAYTDVVNPLKRSFTINQI